MKTCPVCKETVKSRLNGACPHCSTEIELHDGVYYKSGVGSPALAVLKCFEDHVTRHASWKQGREVIFSFKKKAPSYKREMVEAQRLLQECDYDLVLVYESLNVLFFNKQFNFKTRTSMIGIRRDFPLAMAIAETTLAERNKHSTREHDSFEYVMNKEDIFGG